MVLFFIFFFFFFQAEDGIRDLTVTGVQTCALPICSSHLPADSASSVVVCLFDVAPGGGCRVSLRTEPARLCGPVRRLAAPGRYPAPCSVEPGLSSGS